MAKKVLAVVALTVFSFVATTATAGPTPGQKCAASKKQTAGKKSKCKEGCDSKAGRCLPKKLPTSERGVVLRKIGTIHNVILILSATHPNSLFRSRPVSMRPTPVAIRHMH